MSKSSSLSDTSLKNKTLSKPRTANIPIVVRIEIELQTVNPASIIRSNVLELDLECSALCIRNWSKQIKTTKFRQTVSL